MCHNTKLILLTAVLVFSCKTADETLSEDPGEPAAAVETVVPEEAVSDQELTLDKEEAVEVPLESEAGEELPVAPGKELDKSGGIKKSDSAEGELIDEAEEFLSAAVEAELPESDFSGTESSDDAAVAVEDEPENLPPMAEEPEFENPVAEDSPIPVIDADVTDDADTETAGSAGAVVVLETPTGTNREPIVSEAGKSLPSEYDSVPSNPLLPVVIEGGGQDEAASEPEAPVEQVRQEETEALVVQDKPSTVLPAASRPIGEDEYTLSTDPTGKLSVSLDGAGWVFLSGGENSAYTLYEKLYDPETGQTVFLFRVDSGKNFDSELQFMKQDILKGESEDRVLPMNRELFLSLDSGENEAPANSADVQEMEADIIETETVPEEAAELTGDGSDDPFLGIIESADSPEERAAVYSEQDLDGMSASELYELARRYETPGRDQSLEKAKEIYMRIRNTYPVTEERFLAEDRIRYLDRYYFKVQ